MFWKVRARPRAAIWCGRTPRMLSPRNSTDPRCGRYTPDSTLNSEVLPAPLGPMIANSSPGSTSKLTPLIALTPEKDRWTSRMLAIGPG